MIKFRNAHREGLWKLIIHPYESVNNAAVLGVYFRSCMWWRQTVQTPNVAS